MLQPTNRVKGYVNTFGLELNKCKTEIQDAWSFLTKPKFY